MKDPQTLTLEKSLKAASICCDIQNVYYNIVVNNGDNNVSTIKVNSAYVKALEDLLKRKDEMTNNLLKQVEKLSILLQRK